MKELLHRLDKAFENRIRLGIMSALMVEEFVDFNSLKELLGASDGNLASHLKALEKVDYVQHRKEFLGRKPHTKYTATALGTQAFKRHIQALEQLLK